MPTTSDLAVKDADAYPEHITLAQVRRMWAGKNTDRIPEYGLVYDGIEPAGAPFETRYVSGIFLPETMELAVGDSQEIAASIAPEDASLQGVL